MSQIQEGLFLGTWENAKDKQFLNSNNISHIIITAPAVQRFFPLDFNYKTLPLLDTDKFDPYPFFDQAADYITQAQKDGTGVLVHDFKGDSRGPAMLSGWFMREFEMNYVSAFNLILSRRPEARISSIWVPVLKRWEKECVH